MLKEGVFMNGMVSAIKGFAYKCGSAMFSSGILAIPALTCVIIIVCLLFNPIEPHRADIDEMKEHLKANDEV